MIDTVNLKLDPTGAWAQYYLSSEINSILFDRYERNFDEWRAEQKAANLLVLEATKPVKV